LHLKLSLLALLLARRGRSRLERVFGAIARLAEPRCVGTDAADPGEMATA
jgi:hypothetical protein